MSALTLRLVKGSPLTNQEVDDNFSNLNTDKYQSGASPDFVDTLTDKLSLDTSAAATAGTGEMAWNAGEETADLGLNASVTLQVGQKLLYHVQNNTGSTIANGTLCMAAGSLGGSGKILIKPWDGSGPSKYIMGIATQSIATASLGFVTHFGKVRGIQTNGANYGETWVDGDILYAKPAGGLTKTMPTAPNPKTTVAIVINAHASNGILFVRPTFGSSLDEDEKVNLSSPADGEVLTYVGANSRWENKTLNADPAGTAVALAIALG